MIVCGCMRRKEGSEWLARLRLGLLSAAVPNFQTVSSGEKRAKNRNWRGERGSLSSGDGFKFINARQFPRWSSWLQRALLPKGDGRVMTARFPPLHQRDFWLFFAWSLETGPHRNSSCSGRHKCLPPVARLVHPVSDKGDLQQQRRSLAKERKSAVSSQLKSRDFFQRLTDARTRRRGS